MKTKQVIGEILKAIPVGMVIISALGGIYAAYNKISGISWASPIILTLISIGYFVGIKLSKEKIE